jgi:DNA-binding transcriptional MerR regulator
LLLCIRFILKKELTQGFLTAFMAYKEKEIEKIYYSIGEVAEMFNVAPSLIRFWESEFELIHPKKNRKGNRQFTKEDIDNVRTIYHLVKEKGFTLQGAKEMLRNDTQSVKNKMELLDSLKKVRSFLVEVRERLR